MNTNYNVDCDILNNHFPGVEKIKKNFSQAYQDLFVLTMLQGKRSGKYLEVGANHPVEFNNTFLLEDTLETQTGVTFFAFFYELYAIKEKRLNDN